MLCSDRLLKPETQMRCEHSNGRSVAKKQVVHTLDGLEWCRLWAMSCDMNMNMNGVASEMVRSEESGWLVVVARWVVVIAGWLGKLGG